MDVSNICRQMNAQAWGAQERAKQGKMERLNSTDSSAQRKCHGREIALPIPELAEMRVWHEITQREQGYYFQLLQAAQLESSNRG
jgi:hypothetical protein